MNPQGSAAKPRGGLTILAVALYCSIALSEQLTINFSPPAPVESPLVGCSSKQLGRGGDLEIWKPVVGFEGIYEVSDRGRVRRLAETPKCHRNRVLRQGLDSNGYLGVTFCTNGRSRTTSVHRVVLAAFLGPNPKSVVNHKDGCKQNNNLSNLEYCTYSENAYHAWRTGLRKKVVGSEHHSSKLDEATVVRIREEFSKNPDRSRIARLFKISKTSLQGIVTKSTWRHAV